MSLRFCGVYVLRYESGILWDLCVEGMSLGFCGVYLLRYESGILWGLCVEV